MTIDYPPTLGLILAGGLARRMGGGDKALIEIGGVTILERVLTRLRDADRDTMVQTIRTLKRPVIHYKVLAAGRNKPQEALPFVAKHLRPQDVVCVGYCLKDNGNAIQENLAILERALAGASQPKAVAAAV